MSGKHSINKKTKSKKHLLIFIIILIIIFGVFFLYNNFILNNNFDDLNNIQKKSKNKNLNNSPTHSSLNLEELSNESNVQNSDTLHAESIVITENSDNTYLVSSSIKNNSSESQEKCNIKLLLYNSKQEELTSIKFNVDTILPDGKSTLLTISSLDLADCRYYLLSLEK